MEWLNSSPSLQPLQRQKQHVRRRLQWLLAAFALLGALQVTASHAQLFKWVDENGKTQYTDTIPPASTDRARKELRSDGTVKLSTDRAATAEERRLAALKALDDAKLRAVLDEHDRKDRALLNTYTSLADFDRVRDRALSTLLHDIRVLEEREVLLNHVISSDGKFSPPVAGNSVAPSVALKSTGVKMADMLLLGAKSELPLVKSAIATKRHDLDGLSSLYAIDRVRLSRLIELESAKMTSDQRAAQAQAVAPAKKK